MNDILYGSQTDRVAVFMAHIRSPEQGLPLKAKAEVPLKKG
jgi:hypothetical protein